MPEGMEVRPVSRIDRLACMVKSGLNVPRYVINPCREYESGTLITLRAIFAKSPRVTLLAKRGLKITELEDQNLNSAFMSASSLEYDNYEVWVMEQVDCEYEGTIWMKKDGSCNIKIGKTLTMLVDYTAEQSVVMRSILRRVFNFVVNYKINGVCVDFGWAKNFCGIFYEKVVFFDCLPLKKTN